MSLVRRAVATKTGKGNWEKTVQFRGGEFWLPKLKGTEVPLRLQHHAPVMRRREEKECWNSVQLTEGRILTVHYSASDFSLAGNYREGTKPFDLDAILIYDDSYPDCCLSHWQRKRFNGQRYTVSVCHGNTKIKIVCTSIDGRKYKVGDQVILLYIREWRSDIENNGEPLSEVAEGIYYGHNYNRKKIGRAGTRPGKEFDIVENALDGTFVIVPFRVPGILEDQENMIEFASWGELSLAKIYSGMVHTNYPLWYEAKCEVEVKVTKEEGYINYIGVPLYYYRLLDRWVYKEPAPFEYSSMDEPQTSLNAFGTGYVLVLNKEGIAEPVAEDLLVFGDLMGLPIENKYGWSIGLSAASVYFPFSKWIDGRISYSPYRWDCYEYGGLLGQCPPEQIPWTEYPIFWEEGIVDLQCWSPFWCLGVPNPEPPYPAHEVWCSIWRTHPTGRGVRPPFDIQWKDYMQFGMDHNTPPMIDAFCGLILGIDDDSPFGNYPTEHKGIWAGYRAEGDGATFINYFGIDNITIGTLPLLDNKFGYFRLTANLEGLLTLYTKNEYNDALWIEIGSTNFPGTEINIFYFTSYQQAKATEEASELLPELPSSIGFLQFIRGTPPGGHNYDYG